MAKNVSTAALVEFVLKSIATDLTLFPWRPHRAFEGRSESVADYHARLSHLYKASAYRDPEHRRALTRCQIEAVLTEYARPPPTVLDAFESCITQLVEANNLLFKFPDPPSGDIGHDTLLRQRLEECQPFLVHEPRIRKVFNEVIIALMCGLLDAFPETMHDRDAARAFAVPAYAIIPDLNEIVARVLVTFLSETVFEDDYPGTIAFAGTRSRLIDNLLNASGLTNEQAERYPNRIVGPLDSKLSPQDLIKAYLAGTGLDRIFMAEVPLSIPREAFQEHGAVFAPSGHGKTQLLQHVIASFIDEDDPPAMFIIDGMGSMLKKLERLPAFQDRLKDRLIVFDPHDRPPLNFFQLRGGSEAQQLELFTYLFAAFDHELSPKMATTVRFIVKLMQQIPQASLQTMFELLTENPKTAPATFAAPIARLPEIPRTFFKTQFFTTNFRPTLEAVQSRLYTVLENDAFKEMFSAPTNCFDPVSFIAEKKIVLLNTDRAFLSDEGSAVLGRFFIAQCLAAALSRAKIPPEERHLALLIVDEAKDYFDAKTEKILTDARQFGLGLFFATQFVGQLDPDVRAAMYNNTRIKMAGPVETDTDTIATALRTTPKFILSMRSKDRQYAEFATYIRGLTDTALKLTIPYGTVEKQIRDVPPTAPSPTPPKSTKQDMNEFSLRDVDLPLPEVIVTPPPPKDAIYPGDWVLVEIEQQLMFKSPVQVRDVQYFAGRAYILVADEVTAFELHHCTKVPPPTQPPSPPKSPPPDPLDMIEPE